MKFKLCLSVCLSVCLSLSLSLSLSACLSVCLSACLPACLSVCLFVLQSKASISSSPLPPPPSSAMVVFTDISYNIDREKHFVPFSRKSVCLSSRQSNQPSNLGVPEQRRRVSGLFWLGEGGGGGGGRGGSCNIYKACNVPYREKQALVDSHHYV